MSLGNNGAFALIPVIGSTAEGVPPGVPADPYQFQFDDTMRGRMHGSGMTGGGFSMPSGGGVPAGTPSWASGLIRSPTPDTMMSYTPPDVKGSAPASDDYLKDLGPMGQHHEMMNRWYFEQAKKVDPNYTGQRDNNGIKPTYYDEYNENINYANPYSVAKQHKAFLDSRAGKTWEDIYGVK